MMIDDKFNGQIVKTGCACFFQPQTEHKIVKIGDDWFIEESRWNADRQLFEIAICEFCPRCNGFQFRDIPTTADRTTPEGMIYVVCDNTFIFATTSRVKAKNMFIERLNTFNNPYGQTAGKECYMDLVKLS